MPIRPSRAALTCPAPPEVDPVQGYRLYTVVPRLLQFVEGLTNIYVRYNRDRLKGRDGLPDCLAALHALFGVLLTTCQARALESCPVADSGLCWHSILQR